MIDQIKSTLKKIKQNEATFFGKDFLLTWDISYREIQKILHVAEMLQLMYNNNIALDCFKSGLAVSNFRDQSTRTRFSYASAANLLGLTVQDLDEAKSQIAHGETVRETANMISFLTEFIGIRDDMYLGEGDKYQREVAESLDLGFQAGILPQRPGVINLQSDIDHPTQTMADLLHLKQYFGNLKKLRGKKIAITWAYSPSYGKPLSVPQGLIGLMTRFGMDVSLAHPEGYELLPEVVKVAKNNAENSGGSFKTVETMPEAFEDADIVYPKSWAPMHVMFQRTKLLKEGNKQGLVELEKQALEQNAKFTSWHCTKDYMDLTKDKNALYMHCLPADITNVSCEQGEVTAEVFDKYRDLLYKQAGYKPYIIASVMMNNKFPNISKVLKTIFKKGERRYL